MRYVPQQFHALTTAIGKRSVVAVFLIPAFAALWLAADSFKQHTVSGREAGLLPRYTGSSPAGRTLDRNQAAPLSLASADFDEDGVPDLIGVYAGPSGGILALYRGNVDSIYPNTPEARERRRHLPEGAAPPPFLPDARAFDLPSAPDFAGAGDFDADGHFDLVVAGRGDQAIYWLAGNGRGEFGEARKIALDGSVTALTTGEVNRADGLADVAVAIAAGGEAKALVFEGPEGALRTRPETFPLPAAAGDLALGRLDEDGLHDLAIAAGRELIVVHGRDRCLLLDPARRAAAPAAKVEGHALPSTIRSLAIGHFTDQSNSQVAALGEDGEIRIVTQPANAGWRTESLRPVDGKTSTASRLVKARFTGGPMDDLVGIGDRLQVLTGELPDGGARGVNGISASVKSIENLGETRGEPVDALPMRLHADARNDLVILRKGGSAPIVSSPAIAATFVVDTARDFPDDTPTDNRCFGGGEFGGCSLRAAIQQANAIAGTDTIQFKIPTESTIPEIAIFSALPTITSPVIIDGTTQGNGFVELAGGPNIGGASGLRITAGNCTVRGLVINRFGSSAIQLLTNGSNVIEGNRLGTDGFGQESLANGGNGVFVSDSAGNTIGGTTAAARNLISGNSLPNIFLGPAVSPSPNVITQPSGNSGRAAPTSIIVGNVGALATSVAGPTTENKVMGNYIGTDVTGARSLTTKGEEGIYIVGANNNIIGGTTAGARNVIAGNAVGEITLSTSGAINENPVSGATTGNQVQGNFIAINVSGNLGLGVGNMVGVSLRGDASRNTIGGTTPAARNVISGTNVGIYLAGFRSGGSDVTGNLVQGNYIGTDAAGTGRLGNRIVGVGIETFTGNTSIVSNNTIGGAAAGAGNVIAFNGGEVIGGIAIFSNGLGGRAIGNSILGNSIFSNERLGIDLEANGVTQNDPGDSDVGANNLQNHPELTGAVTNGATTTLRGTLNSAPNGTYRIEFFENTACDPSGSGEGQTYRGFTSVTTDAQGNAAFSFNLPATVAIGRFITATATDANGNTSEFSRCAQVVGCPAFPAAFIPFQQVYAITPPDASGDRVIVARATIDAFNRIRQLPLPQFPNERYCVEVELAPGVLATAYVPSANERSGNFSAFGQPIRDPINNQPFPGNIIPANRMPDPFAWRVANVRQIGADLAVTLSDAPDPVLVNNLLTYTATVTNNGPGPATGVTLTDVLPANVTLNSTAPTQGSCGAQGGTITCNLGTIQSGATARVNIVVNVLPAAAGTLGNTVTVRRDQTDPNPGNDSATATTTVGAVADLVMAKSAAPSLPGPGDRLTYTLTLRNTGPNAAANVTVTDQLPANTAFVSYTAPSGWNCTTPPAGSGGGTLACSANALGAGASANITLVVRVGNTVPGGTVIANTARAASSTFESNGSNNTGSVTTTTGAPLARIVPNATLEMGPVPALRERSPNPASANFAIENAGNATLYLRFSGVERTGADVDSGKITNRNDDSQFTVIANGSSELKRDAFLAVGPGQSSSFRVTFNPRIPILAGSFRGIPANLVLPDVITSRLAFTMVYGEAGDIAGNTIGVNLIGRITPTARMIHPCNPSRDPLVTIAQSGGRYTVESSIFDPNLDLYLMRYEFFDNAGGAVGGPRDVDMTRFIQQSPLTRGQGFTVEQPWDGPSSIARVKVTIFDRAGNESFTSLPIGQTERCSFSTVSAASFTESGLSNESIVAGFGTGLASGTQAASGPTLPTQLGGVSVRVKDGAGAERLAPLFFVSPSQINYQIPAGSSLGAAAVTVSGANGTTKLGAVNVAGVSPGLFSANSDGLGVAAAVLLRVKADGSQVYEPVARFDAAQKRFVPVPINFGPAAEQLFLILFGSGIRGRSVLSPVSVTIGSVNAPVLFAGAQGGLAGLDQINVALPRELAGRGALSVALTVEGRTANPVIIHSGGGSNLTRLEAAITAREWGESRQQTENRIVMPLIRLTRPVTVFEERK